MSGPTTASFWLVGATLIISTTTSLSPAAAAWGTVEKVINPWAEAKGFPATPAGQDEYSEEDEDEKKAVPRSGKSNKKVAVAGQARKGRKGKNKNKPRTTFAPEMTVDKSVEIVPAVKQPAKTKDTPKKGKGSRGKKRG
ncbi:uncharacterized protein LOC132200846 [Neocloeon triangulifer]|uniref:uncharacterized protein LOC132200846 n=1 Tax=Neocloeon triangulifer TaxID=2078957 RepID=UPI00286F4CC0|nr:uncharacterized protein LOC132200846 [Neocloeon triangulifer]